MSNYFKKLPNLQYPSLNPESNSLFDFDEVKNFFRRVSIKDEYFQNITFFYKYEIKGNDRPDNVAEKIYNDPLLDWIVTLSNNIIDIYEEWPMDDITFYDYLNKKYPNQSYLNTKYYETTEVKDSRGRLILPEGLVVESNYQIKNPLDPVNTINPVKPISYLDIERRKNNDKRNIFLLKNEYVSQVTKELSNILYKKSDQYLNKFLKKVENYKSFNT